jgi:hypothetical protein
MLRVGYGEACIMPRADFGEGIFLRDPWDDHGGYPGVYVTHYVPLELLKDPSTINVRDPEILQEWNESVNSQKTIQYGQ